MFTSSRVLALMVLTLCLAGCGEPAKPPKTTFEFGEKAALGPLIYTVVETSWATQLGQGFELRSPKQRFLQVTVSITNSGGREVTLPLLSLEDSSGKSYQEEASGQGVDNWLGLLRSVQPAQTLQGRMIFDVPLSSYELKITDGGEAGTEKYASIKIPLRIEGDTQVQAPLPGTSAK